MIKLTVSPTPELIELGAVTYRVYGGTDEHGVQVRMLVAALAIESGQELKGHEPLVDRGNAVPLMLKPSERARLAACLIRTGLKPDTL